MDDIYNLFCTSFPYYVHASQKVRALLENKACHTLVRRSGEGVLMGAAVVYKNTLLLLCVDVAYRGRGVGSKLLEEAEETVLRSGYSVMTVGAGEKYIMPGVPSDRPVVPEEGLSVCHTSCLDDSAVRFFGKRGYRHSWDCNCFDMLLDLERFSAEAGGVDGVVFRRAMPDDLQRVVDCIGDAYPSFARYYENPALYEPSRPQWVMMAEADGTAAGAVIVEKGDSDTGSVGCTAVREEYQGRKIASNLVILGTADLKKAGVHRAFIGYTYSGLQRLYGRAGYEICTYYLMAQKDLNGRLRQSKKDDS